MLKATIDTLESVDESLQQFYKEKDGKFQLAVDGLEDTGALKRAKDHEKDARIIAESKSAEFKTQLDALQASIADGADDDFRRKGDVAALDASWQSKYDNREGELKGQLDGLNGSLKTLLVDNEAIRIASELSVEGSAGLLIPHIQSRLSVDTKDGKMVTVVNDVNGAPSALTVDELKAEFANNPAFAPVIVGSKASGGGAGGGNNGPGGASMIDMSKATLSEKVAHIKSKRGS